MNKRRIIPLSEVYEKVEIEKASKVVKADEGGGEAFKEWKERRKKKEAKIFTKRKMKKSKKVKGSIIGYVNETGDPIFAK